MLEDAPRPAVALPKNELDALATSLGRQTIVNHHELVLGTTDCYPMWDIATRILNMVPEGLGITEDAGWLDQFSFVRKLVPYFIGSSSCDFWWCSLNSCHYQFAKRNLDDPRLQTHQDNSSIKHTFPRRGSPLQLDDLILPSGFAWAYESPEGFPAEEAQIAKLTIRRRVKVPTPEWYSETWLCKAHPESHRDLALLSEGKVPTAHTLGGESTDLRTTPFLSLHRVKLTDGFRPELGVFGMELHPRTGHFVSLRYCRLSMEADLVGGPHELRLLNQVFRQYR
jgi:hypothetical protein